ncbi:hypothetical protein LUZ60_013450 [Juncus effusus]|nr:hypothetical protein LUZ60_013450 [Juncus effusus]
MEIDAPNGPSPSPSEPYTSSPPRIRRLDTTVVNRIAAGEVIQRPSAAVKELVENSLDAGSASVSVSVKDGGLKLLLVSDDGHGIRYEDLPILCERHTTSKLSNYEDLQTIKSMGFRGEALASMTYVGHVTVTTITEGQQHGYRVSYKDGVMEHEPRPCAAVKGTQIMVENLFYNMAARRKTLQNANDEYPKIVDLISRFAVHYTNVNFSCRKYGTNKADVHTVNGSSRLDSIRTVYGSSVARDLMEISVSDDGPARSVFQMEGFISSSNYVAKKTTMILFINDRQVDCTALKRAIEVVYSATLPKAAKPFIYMSIKLPSEHVDVNIHPTKREVSLLNQESLIDTIQSAIEAKLMSCNTARVFQMQAASSSMPTQVNTKKDNNSGTPSQKVPVNKMVRTDSKDPFGRLHSYYKEEAQSSQQEKKPDLTSVRSVVIARRNWKENTDFTSLDELVREIDSNFHSGLLDIIKNCTYIGLADEVFAVLQYNTDLYLVNIVNVSKELMYQQVVRRFAKFNAIQLSEPAPLKELLLMALREEDLETKEDEGLGDFDDLKEKIAQMNIELLKEKEDILEDYFGVKIENGSLIRLPVVLDQYIPDMDRIPEFLLSLGNDVEWENERECFQTISAIIANFYALHPPILPNPSGDGINFYKKNNPSGQEGEEGNEELLAEAETAWSQREWNIQHVLFPSMRLFLKPPKCMATNGTFVQVASLDKLYKVFERC